MTDRYRVKKLKPVLTPFCADMLAIGQAATWWQNGLAGAFTFGIWGYIQWGCYLAY